MKTISDAWPSRPAQYLTGAITGPQKRPTITLNLCGSAVEEVHDRSSAARLCAEMDAVSRMINDHIYDDYPDEPGIEVNFDGMPLHVVLYSHDDGDIEIDGAFAAGNIDVAQWMSSEKLDELLEVTKQQIEKLQEY